jgi:dynein heavy chain
VAKAFDQKINDQVPKNPSIMVNCISLESTLAQLKALYISFDACQKSLSSYLQTKKMFFPRFYFISDEDLLNILGSNDPQNLQPYLIKLFDNYKKLIFEGNKISGMESDEGEQYAFKEPFKPDGAVENWMTEVESSMEKTLRSITKEGTYKSAKMERTQWIEESLGMVAIAGCQIWWTWRVEDVFRKVEEGDKYAMKEELKKQSKDLDGLIEMVRQNWEERDPKGLQRKKFNTLIIIDVHARDIVDRFVKDSILSAREFEWESQLRFYWLNSINDIQIQQCTGKFNYGYEYQGLNGRLVITPLTDR